MACTLLGMRAGAKACPGTSHQPRYVMTLHKKHVMTCTMQQRCHAHWSAWPCIMYLTDLYFPLPTRSAHSWWGQGPWHFGNSGGLSGAASYSKNDGQNTALQLHSTHMQPALLLHAASTFVAATGTGKDKLAEMGTPCWLATQDDAPQLEKERKPKDTSGSDDIPHSSSAKLSRHLRSQVSLPRLRAPTS